MRNSWFGEFPSSIVLEMCATVFPCTHVVITECTYLKVTQNFVSTITIMMHISASTAPIRVKQKPLYPQLNAECDKHYYNSLFKGLGNPLESLNGVEVGCTNNAVQHPYFECL